MNKTRNTPFIVAFVVVVLFLVFIGGAMTGGMMNGSMGKGWLGERNWMLYPALFTLGLGVVRGWVTSRKTD